MGVRFVDSNTFTILDLLDADRGWLSSGLLVEAIPEIKPKSVRRNLLRLRNLELVEAREIPRYTPGSPEHEYRITEAGRQRIDMAVAA